MRAWRRCSLRLERPQGLLAARSVQGVGRRGRQRQHGDALFQQLQGLGPGWPGHGWAVRGCRHGGCCALPGQSARPRPLTSQRPGVPISAKQPARWQAARRAHRRHGGLGRTLAVSHRREDAPAPHCAGCGAHSRSCGSGHHHRRGTGASRAPTAPENPLRWQTSLQRHGHAHNASPALSWVCCPKDAISACEAGSGTRNRENASVRKSAAVMAKNSQP
jgi:hypothetical protein